MAEPTPSRPHRLWLGHPTGNTFARALVEALHAEDLLETFFTCVAIGEDERNPVATRLFGQRRCDIPSARIETRPLRELGRLLSQKIPGTAALRRHETGPFCVDRVYRDLDETIARRLRGAARPPSAVYLYEDGARATFEAARERGVKRIYDLPIGYWRTARSIQTEEAERQPEWASTMPALRDSEPKLLRKDAELGLAQGIVVASRFTADTLKEAPFPLPEAVIVPYGCPPLRDRPPEGRTGGPLRVLFVGSLSQRKGLAYLLEAVEQLGGAVELTLIGRRVADCRPLDAALRKHRWIESLPHAQVLETMRQQDVLVFPSLFEGFGLVLTEALSQGLPVIATPHTAAPDLIEDGREGFVVPIRDSAAIRDKLDLIAREPDRLAAMGRAALEKARLASWEAYRNGMVAAVRSMLGGLD